ncbi:hypothetical protein HDU91_007104 [Kappamyces sp. JEL0680]|nr:hypothetical protein HDU91_007104 [Kappamyces sp. JEL0680]
MHSHCARRLFNEGPEKCPTCASSDWHSAQVVQSEPVQRDLRRSNPLISDEPRSDDLATIRSLSSGSAPKRALPDQQDAKRAKTGSRSVKGKEVVQVHPEFDAPDNESGGSSQETAQAEDTVPKRSHVSHASNSSSRSRPSARSRRAILESDEES